MLYLEFPHIARAYIYHPICGCCSLKSANNNVRRGGLHRRFQILRPTYHRPSIRPIFQRHNRFERKREIKHFGFHLLRPRDHEFKSGTVTTCKRRIRSRCIHFLSSFLRSFAFGNERILRVWVEKGVRDSDFEFSFPFWGEAPRGGFLHAEDSRVFYSLSRWRLWSNNALKL